MSELTKLQRRTLFALYDVCQDINALAVCRSQEADGLDAEQVDSEGMEPKLERLEREVGYALQKGVPTELLNRIKTEVLPEQYRHRFKAPAGAVA